MSLFFGRRPSVRTLDDNALTGTIPEAIGRRELPSPGGTRMGTRRAIGNLAQLTDFAHVLARISDFFKKLFRFWGILKVRYFHRYLELEKVLGMCDY